MRSFLIVLTAVLGLAVFTQSAEAQRWTPVRNTACRVLDRTHCVVQRVGCRTHCVVQRARCVTRCVVVNTVNRIRCGCCCCCTDSVTTSGSFDLNTSPAGGVPSPDAGITPQSIQIEVIPVPTSGR
jgi:hypothetical protein